MRKQKFKVGDVFSIPLHLHLFAFGRVTPQYEFLEFFDITLSHLPNLTELQQAGIVRVSYLVDMDALVTWEWKIFENLPYGLDEFRIQPFRIGDTIAVGTEVNNEGFIDVTSKFRPALIAELDEIPWFRVYPKDLVVEKLISVLVKNNL